jgi:hypothetical protein
MMNVRNPADEALVSLLAELKSRDYRFTTVGNPTHRRVIGRDRDALGVTLRDVFGWSRAFDPEVFDPVLVALLRRAGCLVEHATSARSAVRVSSMGDDLLLHSGWPANTPNAVFFGPDTYRFARYLNQTVGALPAGSKIIDLGTGSGAGGIVAARCAPDAAVILTDINPLAARFAAVNACAAGINADVRLGDGLYAAPAMVDLVIANPPFIAGATGRVYRAGGDRHGGRLALEWIEAALPRLRLGGHVLMYTGATVVDGVDQFLCALRTIIEPRMHALTYEELDPDIFGSELNNPAYADAERIAAVGLRVTRTM